MSVSVALFTRLLTRTANVQHRSVLAVIRIVMITALSIVAVTVTATNTTREASAGLVLNRPETEGRGR